MTGQGWRGFEFNPNRTIIQRLKSMTMARRRTRATTKDMIMILRTDRREGRGGDKGGGELIS